MTDGGMADGGTMKRIEAVLELDSDRINKNNLDSNWQELLTDALEACQGSAAAIGAQCERIAQLEISGLDTDQAEASLSRMIQIAEQNYSLLSALLQFRDLSPTPAHRPLFTSAE
jgi:Mor family transcriptional regulator